MKLQISRNGIVFGEYEPWQVARMKFAGSIRVTDLYWTAGMENWEPLITFKIPPVIPETESVALMDFRCPRCMETVQAQADICPHCQQKIASDPWLDTPVQIARNGKIIGNFSQSEIDLMRRTGTLPSTDAYLKPGMSQWKTFDEEVQEAKKKKEKDKHNESIGCLILAIIAAIGVFLFQMCKSNIDDSMPSSSQRSAPTEIDARVMAEVFIKKQLKAPLTAVFSEVKSTTMGSGEFLVTGMVDSQNSFGAMLRTGFEIRLRNEYADKWKMEYLKLGNDEIGNRY
jgi:hypothetical protein